MKEFIQDIKTINKAVPLARTCVFFVGIVAVVVAAGIIIFPDEKILGIIDGAICALLSISVTAALTAAMSGQRYTLLTSLPVKAENIPRTVFRLFELTVCICFLLCAALPLALGKVNEALSVLIIGLAFSIVSYVMLLLTAVPEYAAGMNNGAKMLGVMMIYFVIGGSVGILSAMFGELSEEGATLGFSSAPAIYPVAAALLTAVLIIRHFAFKKYIKIIRVIKKG